MDLGPIATITALAVLMMEFIAFLKISQIVDQIRHKPGGTIGHIIRRTVGIMAFAQVLPVIDDFLIDFLTGSKPDGHWPLVITINFATQIIILLAILLAAKDLTKLTSS